MSTVKTESPERVMRLSEVKPNTILYKIAEAWLKFHPDYKCILAGEKVTIKL